MSNQILFGLFMILAILSLIMFFYAPIDSLYIGKLLYPGLWWVGSIIGFYVGIGGAMTYNDN